jgi:hypothetical protein
MLEAAASSILFPVRIDLGFERNISCNLSVSRRRSPLFAPNRLFQISGRKTCIS